MITCHLCQRMISSRLDANRELSGWVQRHTESCPDCRKFYSSATAIAQQLSASADTERRQTSPFLHGKIMSAIRQSEREETQLAHGRFNWTMLAASACLVLLAGMVWMRETKPMVASIHPPQPSPGMLALNIKLPSGAQVDQWARNLDAPLAQETQLVIGDARNALQFLADGFLPSKVQVVSPESAER